MQGFKAQIEDLTFEQTIRNIIEDELLDTHTAFPAKVISYDSSHQTVSLQPLLKTDDVTGTPVEPPVLDNVQVMFPSCSGGDAYIHLPIKKDDTGICIIIERDIDEYKVNNTTNLTYVDNEDHHDINSAIFYPGTRTIPEAFKVKDPNELIIKNNSMTVALSPKGRVKLQGRQYELLRVLQELIEDLISAKTVTMLGAQPFTADTVANLTLVKEKLDTLIN